ncbi:MAG: hypothetical protein BZ137_09055 [Methanosphaera sp. rholeuAM130]|nr:MAG: hypothetical protein BZ137_09055 [Methanosphaera sp. rholeuAM130]
MNFNVKNYSIIMIILGIITMVFPLVIPTTVSIIFGLFFIFVALLFLLFAYQRYDFQRNSAIFNIIVAIIFIMIGIYLMLNPDIIIMMFKILLYAMAIILIVSGVYSIISGVFRSFTLWGIVNIVFGVISLIMAYLFANPNYLGIVVGLWFLICGILSLFDDDE